MQIFSTHLSDSAETTERLGAMLAKAMTDDEGLPRFVALYGDLGVGKTAFVRGYASVIASSATVKSPTFSLVNEYRGQELSLFHFDMYRISDGDELYAIGFYDYLDRRGVCLVEWSENIEEDLPNTYIKVSIEKNSHDNPDSRIVTIQSVGF